VFDQTFVVKYSDYISIYGVYDQYAVTNNLYKYYKSDHINLS